jgi:cytoplasmic iron level regulating protein YaaA (DUF328/UPF0246 family)
MRIIISPAKKMNRDTDTLPWKDLPCFIEQAEMLYSKLQSMSQEELKKLWKCNDAIAALNMERLATTDLRTNLTPAILAYEGIQYQYMAPGVFTREELDYIQEHLRILSGLYGVLRPFDGVTPYRLEMQAKLNVCDVKDLYRYWNSLIAENIFRETDCVINLASREYSLCVSRYQKPGSRIITCVFGEEKDGKIVEKGTLCKMARGEMVRYLAETGAESPEALKGFSRLNYIYSPEHSDEDHCVFLLTKGGDSRN